ncbi:MAG: hypothetical protein IT275_12025 [Chitinophagales bacterium]|nr:hypothetical protein [Chitinophagales bacterium]HMV14804.1 hypothetical protein [Chitinophagales bacterium]HMW13278.1 hypothetical protein [Chitinophagales bacterium]HMX60818.1 hypothetical protein [Chitinophagales bacterium]HMY22634.1 hypothetical protein [Chitinophagales bacterium]
MKTSVKFSIILFCIFSLIFSCKKKSLTPNNPDVNSRIIDSVSVVPAGNGRSEAPIDADEDGTTDFYLVSYTDDDAYITSLDAEQVIGDNNFSTDGFNGAAVYNEQAIIDSVSVPKGPRPPKAIWDNLANCSYVAFVGGIEGLAGKGDSYLGFYLEKSDGKHYGWLKLNIPADGKSIKLISIGYHTKPRTAILAGEL